VTQLIPADVKRRTKHQFDAWADSYDRSLLNHFLFRPAYLAFMEEIARWYAERGRSFRLLDVGCGTGTFAGWLAASPWPVSVVGIDYAEGMCRAASAKAKRGHAPSPSNAGVRKGTVPFSRGEKGDGPLFLCGDSEHLPLADGTFDLVTCSNSFHHYPHQQAVVKEMRRVLRPGGRLILIDGFRDNIIGWIIFDVIVGRVEGNVHHAPWTVVHDYFTTAGFTYIRHRKLNFWFPLLVIVGDVEQRPSPPLTSAP
jgi:ubiquinone/menaquinone biosynthesis C-methylase UbiE